MAKKSLQQRMVEAALRGRKVHMAAATPKMTERPKTERQLIDRLAAVIQADGRSGLSFEAVDLLYKDRVGRSLEADTNSLLTSLKANDGAGGARRKYHTVNPRNFHFTLVNKAISAARARGGNRR